MKISTRSFFKKSMCVLFSFVCLQASLFSQDVILTTQAEVDAFDPATTVIDGDLIIGESNFDNILPASYISDISKLSNLTSVSGSLRILFNENLQNINALSNITNIGINLEVGENINLQSINGFANITSVGGDLIFYRNNELTNLDGFSKLNSLGGKIDFFFHEKLENIDGLSQLQSIGDLIYFGNNNALKNINGISSLTYAKGIYIADNPSLQNLDGLNNLKIVGLINVEPNDTFWVGWIIINNNSSLEHIDGLSNLESLFGSISLMDNENLENIDGLSSLKSAGSITIENCNELTHLDGLSNVLSIHNNLRIVSNSKLSDCCGISQLLSDSNAVGDSITVLNNPFSCGSIQEIIDQNCPMLSSINDDIPTNSYFKIQAFPNPANDMLYFNHEGSHPLDYKIYNTSGKLLLSANYEKTVDVSGLNNGTYLLQITNAQTKESTVKKIIVAR